MYVDPENIYFSDQWRQGDFFGEIDDLIPNYRANGFPHMVEIRGAAPDRNLDYYREHLEDHIPGNWSLLYDYRGWATYLFFQTETDALMAKLLIA